MHATPPAQEEIRVLPGRAVNEDVVLEQAEPRHVDIDPFTIAQRQTEHLGEATGKIRHLLDRHPCPLGLETHRGIDHGIEVVAGQLLDIFLILIVVQVHVRARNLGEIRESRLDGKVAPICPDRQNRSDCHEHDRGKNHTDRSLGAMRLRHADHLAYRWDLASRLAKKTIRVKGAHANGINRARCP